MKYDITDSILSKIYTTNQNILGMLNILSVIMDSNSYKEFYDRYLEIEKEIPKDEVLTELEKKYNSFGTELRFTPLEKKLRDFESELEEYNDYKDLNDLLNEVKKDTENIFNGDIVVEEYVTKNKKFIELIIDIKNNKTVHQFTKLLNVSIETVFNSLKTLSVIENSELLDFINQTNSDYLREHIASKIRQSVDTVQYKGKLDDDYLDTSTLYKCAKSDENIVSLMKKAQEYEEGQIALARKKEERITSLSEAIKLFENNIKKYTDNLQKLKLNHAGIKTKKILFRFIAVPAIALPLSCPFIGYKLGKKASSKVLLTKTYTTTVDIDSQDVISSNEDYEELNTTYVASVTICDTWKKNLSGSSYSRNCTVYDYNLPDDKVTDDFHLTLDNIDYNNLVEKYTYEEVTTSVENEKYMKENQIYVTETYQDFTDMIASKKYNFPYTMIGLGIGDIIGFTELFIYLYCGKKYLVSLDNKLEQELKENEKDFDDTNKILKLTLKNLDIARNEYKSLTNKD